MKKAILTALSLILLLLPLTACGADSASTAADTPSPTATSTPAPTQKPAAAPSAKNTSFTNKFGTSKTICAHSGCSSYIARSLKQMLNLRMLHRRRCRMVHELPFKGGKFKQIFIYQFLKQQFFQQRRLVLLHG